MRRHLRGRVEFIWGLFDLVPVMVAAVWGGRRCLRGVWWGGGMAPVHPIKHRQSQLNRWCTALGQ